jgi:hypothetical protein
MNFIFGVFPFFFPKRKKKLRQELEQAIEKRLLVVKEKLHVKEVKKPNLRFWLPYSSPLYIGGSIVLSYPKMLENVNKLTTIIDHEISHHIQHSINPNIKGPYKLEFLSWLYWGLTGKVRWSLCDRAFQEGFATYVAYLTTGKIAKRLETGIELIQIKRRKKLLVMDSDVLPYALGFLSYSLVTMAKSEEISIQMGLSMKPKEWICEVKKIHESIA